LAKLKTPCSGAAEIIFIQISEKVKPHPVVITLLTQVEDVIPKWKIVPTKDVIDAAFKDPVKREKVSPSPSNHPSCPCSIKMMSDCNALVLLSCESRSGETSSSTRTSRGSRLPWRCSEPACT
jgi:hypothetical protein